MLALVFTPFQDLDKSDQKVGRATTALRYNYK